MQGGGKVLILGRLIWKEDWPTLDPHENVNMCRFKFLECVQLQRVD